MRPAPAAAWMVGAASTLYPMEFDADLAGDWQPIGSVATDASGLGMFNHGTGDAIPPNFSRSFYRLGY